MHDIYNPPPAPLAWNPPPAKPLVLTRGDVACLVVFAILLALVSALAWTVEPSLAPLVALGGALVLLESWFTALGFLHRTPSGSLSRRWMIFLAALVPWLVGLGVAAALMMGLFVVSDWAA